MIHYGLYNIGLVVMLPALYLMLQRGNTAIEPIVAVGSLIVAATVLLFAFVVFSSASVLSASSPSRATR